MGTTSIKYLDDQARSGNVAAYLKLGKYFHSQGNMSSALQNFINGSLLGNAECLLLSGIIYKERGAFDYARKCIEQALNSKQLSEENNSKATYYLKEIVGLEESAALQDPEKLERNRLGQELIDEENRLLVQKEETYKAKKAARLKAKEEEARKAEEAHLKAEEERLKAKQEVARQEEERLKAEQEAARKAEEARLVAEKEFLNKTGEMFEQALVLKEQDAQQALSIFLRISKLGLDSLHIKAMKEAAIILRNQKNFSEALKLFRMIEVLGDSQLSKDASYSVGCLLVNNSNSSSSNYGLAYFAFKRAADLGHIKAHYAAAMLLLHHKNIAGVSNPLDLSVNFLQTAASLGHVDSLLQLSLVVANATETQKARPELARIYHERYEGATKSPNVDPEKLNHEAQELIHAKDKASIVKALKRLDKAVDLGHAESAYTAGLMRSGLYWPNLPIAYDHDKAKQCFERGMVLGHKGCKFELALMISKTNRLRSIALLEELLASGDMSVKPYLKAVGHARSA